MPERKLEPASLGNSEDWEGNNAAFSCPVCSKVYIVSGRIHRGRRVCPSCGQSEAYIDGGKKSGGATGIRW